jgi:hypothetical protein
MAGIPQLGVTIDFTNGPAFISTAFTLDDLIKGQVRNRATGRRRRFDRRFTASYPASVDP